MCSPSERSDHDNYNIYDCSPLTENKETQDEPCSDVVLVSIKTDVTHPFDLISFVAMPTAQGRASLFRPERRVP